MNGLAPEEGATGLGNPSERLNPMHNCHLPIIFAPVEVLVTRRLGGGAVTCRRFEEWGAGGGGRGWIRIILQVYRMYRVFKTIFEMLSDRGYLVKDQDLELTVDRFKQERCMLRFGSRVERKL